MKLKHLILFFISPLIGICANTNQFDTILVNKDALVLKNVYVGGTATQTNITSGGQVQIINGNTNGDVSLRIYQTNLVYNNFIDIGFVGTGSKLGNPSANGKNAYFIMGSADAKFEFRDSYGNRRITMAMGISNNFSQGIFIGTNDITTAAAIGLPNFWVEYSPTGTTKWAAAVIGDSKLNGIGSGNGFTGSVDGTYLAISALKTSLADLFNAQIGTSNRMVIQASGRIGVGTGSPAALFHITNGNMQINGNIIGGDPAAADIITNFTYYGNGANLSGIGGGNVFTNAGFNNTYAVANTNTYMSNSVIWIGTPMTATSSNATLFISVANPVPNQPGVIFENATVGVPMDMYIGRPGQNMGELEIYGGDGTAPRIRARGTTLRIYDSDQNSIAISVPKDNNAGTLTLGADGAGSAVSIPSDTLTIGNSAGDVVTMNSTAWAIPNNWNVGSSAFTISNANGFVGIGTASPTARLMVTNGSLKVIGGTTTNFLSFPTVIGAEGTGPRLLITTNASGFLLLTNLNGTGSLILQ